LLPAFLVRVGVSIRTVRLVRLVWLFDRRPLLSMPSMEIPGAACFVLLVIASVSRFLRSVLHVLPDVVSVRLLLPSRVLPHIHLLQFRPFLSLRPASHVARSTMHRDFALICF
jgi:hypothetical protein